MNNSGSAVKIILSVLAAASVVLLVIFIVKSCGSTPDDIDGSNDEVANYGIVETSQTDVSDTDIFIPDNSTIEMDEISSDADVYADEPAN